ncbi:MAG: SDR family oxidoreductase [Rhodothermales bacterium]|nr:SDR family oxidoreductase [Rhodothermales bacterium]
MGITVIYGGTGGIGSAVARTITDRGNSVHLVGRNADRLQEAASTLDCTFTVGDVEDLGVFDRVADDVSDPVDGLVYAVGTINLKSLQRLTEEDYLTDFKVNVLGAALAIKSLIPAMRKSSDAASVVLYSSVAASQGFSLHGSTGMVKGAINGLTLSLAAELAPGIRVNAIAPTLTKTPLASGILSNEKMADALAKQHPLERLGESADMASMTAFLLSSESSFITGQIFGVDGGRSTLR